MGAWEEVVGAEFVGVCGLWLLVWEFMLEFWFMLLAARLDSEDEVTASLVRDGI